MTPFVPAPPRVVPHDPSWARRYQTESVPTAAAEYAAVKAELVHTCSGDSRAYTRGKHDVVERIERAAGVHVP